MLAGVLAGAGYYMGERPMPVDYRPQANPTGLFEDFEVIPYPSLAHGKYVQWLLEEIGLPKISPPEFRDEDSKHLK